jgi:hypothetical protein
VSKRVKFNRAKGGTLPTGKSNHFRMPKKPTRPLRDKRGPKRWDSLLEGRQKISLLVLRAFLKDEGND